MKCTCSDKDKLDSNSIIQEIIITPFEKDDGLVKLIQEGQDSIDSSKRWTISSEDFKERLDILSSHQENSFQSYITFKLNNGK